MPFDGSMGGGSDNSTPCGGCTLFQRVHGFIMQPFTSAASNTEWVLFIGLILIVVYLWARVLGQFTAIVRENL